VLIMSRWRVKRLNLAISDADGKELFKVADKLNSGLVSRLRSAVAAALSRYRKDTFLWNVFMYYNCDVEVVKRELRKQYIMRKER